MLFVWEAWIEYEHGSVPWQYATAKTPQGKVETSFLIESSLRSFEWHMFLEFGIVIL